MIVGLRQTQEADFNIFSVYPYKISSICIDVCVDFYVIAELESR